MPYVVAVLVVLVVVLFAQLQGLRTRLEALERALREDSPAAPGAARPVPTQPVFPPLAGTPAAPPNRPASPRVSPWPARQAGDTAPAGFPGLSLPAPPGPNPVPADPAQADPAQVLPASSPRDPVDVQRWLTRAGIVATLLGVGYVLSVVEAQGRVGPWWQALTGLLLGGGLIGLALRGVRPAGAAEGAADAEQPQTEQRRGAHARQPLWVAEALGNLGLGVTLLTLTFSARSAGGGGLWLTLLTLLASVGALLSRRWSGLTTPLVTLTALSLALLFSRSGLETGHGAQGAEHLWNLSLPGLVCMAWTLSVMVLLPLLIREPDWTVALPGAVALALLLIFAGLTEAGALGVGAPGEQAGVALLVGVCTLLGVLLRPDLLGPDGAAAGLEDRLDSLPLFLRSVIGSLALGTATGAFCRLTGLELRWAVPLAGVLTVVLLSVQPSRRPPPQGLWADPGVLRRLTLSAALAAAIAALTDALVLHAGELGGRSGLPALACLCATVLAALRLGGGWTGWSPDGWLWRGVRAPRLLVVLALCAVLGLLFGVSGVALPLVVWLARWQFARRSPEVPSPGRASPRSWASLRSWHPEPLAVWGLLALPLLSSGALAGSALARAGETALLLLGAAALLAYSLWLLLRPPPGRMAWVLSALLAWSGSWLLAAVLGRVQGMEGETFILTTPFLALLGGWLLFRAQPVRPGDAPWKWGLWLSGAGLLVFALLRVLLSDLSASDPLIRAAGLLGAGLVTVLAGVRFPPPRRS